ncbi:MFS transporter [Staphylococcus rostri]|uniref:MFS transporter n=1 Tax=Staphylococcus rostri TaxID=522262 RepID=A0A2K3YRI0_9STAP|nr:MFS transporter [Staphylococcus rostri]PNZ28215.1 MFS transporter [Staphylococcus rostri]
MSYQSVIKDKRFLVYFLGVSISNFGNALTLFVFPLMVLQITHSPFQLGVVAALGYLPYALLGLPAGALIDRFNKKRVMQYADFARFVAYLSIPIVDYFFGLNIYYIYIVVIISGIALVFHSISEISIIPKIVQKDQLTEANSYIYATQNIAEFIGPIVGGILYASVGYALLLMIDAVTFLISIMSLCLITINYISKAADLCLSDIYSDIKVGIKNILYLPLIKDMLVILVASNLIISPYYIYVVVFVQDVLAGNSTSLGMVFGVASLGALFGSIVTNYLRLKLPWGKLIFITLIIDAMFRFILPFSLTIYLFAIFLAVTYSTQAILNIAIITMRQELTPEVYLGRVNSVFKTAVFAARPVGLFLGGIILESYNSFWSLFFSAILCIILCIFAALRRIVSKE